MAKLTAPWSVVKRVSEWMGGWGRLVDARKVPPSELSSVTNSRPWSVVKRSTE